MYMIVQLHTCTCTFYILHMDDSQPYDEADLSATHPNSDNYVDVIIETIQNSDFPQEDVKLYLTQQIHVQNRSIHLLIDISL